MNRPPAIPALTGLRFFAAFAVLLSHYQYFGIVTPPDWLVPLVVFGHEGVGCFFVLSGYVVAYTYLDRFRDGFGFRRTYIRARVARVAPMYFVALLLMTPITLRFVALPGDVSAATLAASWLVNAAFLEAWLPFAPYSLWNGPEWSLSAEVFFYWLFPAFAFGVLARSQRGRPLLLLGPGLYLCGAILLTGFVLRGPFFLAASRYFPLSRVWEFLIGGVLGTLRLRGWPRGANYDRGIAMVVLGLVVAAYLPRPGLLAYVDWYLYAAPLFVVLVALIGAGTTRFGGILTHARIVQLGEASYALYLLQWPALILVTALAGPDRLPSWIAVPLTAVLITASLAAYRYVESPARRWIRDSVSSPGIPATDRVAV